MFDTNIVETSSGDVSDKFTSISSIFENLIDAGYAQSVVILLVIGLVLYFMRGFINPILKKALKDDSSVSIEEFKKIQIEIIRLSQEVKDAKKEADIYIRLERECKDRVNELESKLNHVVPEVHRLSSAIIKLENIIKSNV